MDNDTITRAVETAAIEAHRAATAAGGVGQMAAFTAAEAKAQDIAEALGLQGQERVEFVADLAYNASGRADFLLDPDNEEFLAEYYAQVSSE